MAVDLIHVDVIDGDLVPNITLGPPIVSAIKPHTSLPLDAHLMIDKPEPKYIADFAKAGADMITVHAEACTHLHRVIHLIKEHGVQAGIAINPGTPAAVIQEVLEDVDMVLIMTVNPGFGGQAFIGAKSSRKYVKYVSGLMKLLSSMFILKWMAALRARRRLWS